MDKRLGTKEKPIMTEKKYELNDDLLDQVVGGAINAFDAPSPKEPYY